MAFSPLGIGNALSALGQGVDSGYYGALGNAYARNLAQQKQTSETNLQSAQAQYFSGRNQTAQQVATTRADGLDQAANLRTTAQMNIATLTQMGKLPPQLAGQDPATVRALIQNMDRMNPNSKLEQSIYGSSPEGLPAGGSPPAPNNGAGLGNGAGGPYLNPMDPSQIGVMPPAGNPAPIPSPMSQPSPMVPMATGSTGLAAPSGGPMAGGLGAMPAGAAAPSTPAGQSGGSSTPLANPFNLPPAVQAKINQSGAVANLDSTRASTLQPLAQSTIAKNMADAGLATSQGKLFDVKTGMEVPLDQAKIRLDAAQSAAAQANASSLPGFRQGLVANGATTAGAAQVNAGAHLLGVQNTGQYQQGMLGVAQQNASTNQGRLSVDQQNANTGQYRAYNPPGAKGLLPNGLPPAQDDALAKESLANVANAARIQHMVNTNVGPDGKTPLSASDKQMFSQQVLSLQQRNAEINRRRTSSAPMLNSGAAGGASGAGGTVSVRGMQLTPAQIQAEIARRAAQNN